MTTVANLTDLIRLNPGEPGRTITFGLSSALLADHSHCSILTDKMVQESQDGGWEIHSATTISVLTIPETPGIYLFVWQPELKFPRSEPHRSRQLSFVLYVGQAGGSRTQGTLRTRFREYQPFIGSSPEVLWDALPLDSRTRRKQCYLSLEPLEYWFLACKTGSDIDGLERMLYDLLKPPMNKQRPKRLRIGHTQPAFRKK